MSVTILILYIYFLRLIVREHATLVESVYMQCSNKAVHTLLRKRRYNISSESQHRWTKSYGITRT